METKQASTLKPYESPKVESVELKIELGILQASESSGSMPLGQTAEQF